MKSVFFTFIMTASIALFALPNDTFASSLVASDVNSHFDNRNHVTAEHTSQRDQFKGRAYGTFRTVNKSTIDPVSILGSSTNLNPTSIPFNPTPVTPRGMKLIVDDTLKNAEVGILIYNKGTYSISFGFSTYANLDNQTPPAAMFELSKNGVLLDYSGVDEQVVRRWTMTSIDVRITEDDLIPTSYCSLRGALIKVVNVGSALTTLSSYAPGFTTAVLTIVQIAP